jgi:hypothetical protein
MTDPKTDQPTLEEVSFVFGLLESQIKSELVRQEDVAHKTFTQLENYIQRILNQENAADTKNKFNTSIWSPIQSSRGYGSMMNFGKQAYHAMKNAISTIMKPPAPIIKEVPETFTPFRGDEHAVQVELQTRSGAQNTVKKLGLSGLKKLGDAFEPIPEETPMEIPAFNP